MSVAFAADGNSGGSALAGTLSVAASNGVASFADILNKTGVAYDCRQLRAVCPPRPTASTLWPAPPRN